MCLGLGVTACATNRPDDGASSTIGSTAMSTPTDPRAADAQSEEQWAYSVGVQNYVFGLPLTIFERERSLRLDPAALEKAKKYAPAAPINQIGHMKTLATADDVMPYTPNNDTVYSGALLELGSEPIILTAPDIPDRYWSVEVADAYTNNVFYLGTRATAGKGGDHAFVGHDGDLAYFQTLADLLTENPPPPGNEAAVEVLSRGGIAVGKPMDVDALSEPMRRGLARAAADGPQIMKWKVKYRGTPYPTRWNNLRPGTYGVDYFDRAAGALEGLFVHDRDEAEYFSTYEDGDAALLDGTNRYLLHFDADQIPPTLPNGFWSITMYGADFQLVGNPIDRFSIGDRTPGLTRNPDGSLDLYIQNQSPAGHQDNWLPSPPKGLFRLNYRIYLPADAAKDPATLGTYLPPIRKVTQ
jgi:hypothetical protein